MRPLNLAKPHIIVTVGIPGSGKTYFASKFSEFFNMSLVSSEKLKVFGAERAGLYMLQEMFKTKASFVYDGDTSSLKLRNALEILAKKSGYKVLFVWIQTEPLTANKRYQKKTRLNDFDKVLKNFNSPVINEKVLVINGKYAFSTQMKMVLARLVNDSGRRDIPIPTTPSRPLVKRSR